MAKKINTEEEPQKEGNKVAAPELPAEAIPEMSEKIPATVEDKRPVPAEKTGNTEDEVGRPVYTGPFEKIPCISVPVYRQAWWDLYSGHGGNCQRPGCTLQKPFL